jgi:hypothetical protein
VFELTGLDAANPDFLVRSRVGRRALTEGRAYYLWSGGLPLPGLVEGVCPTPVDGLFLPGGRPWLYGLAPGACGDGTIRDGFVSALRPGPDAAPDCAAQKLAGLVGAAREHGHEHPRGR